MNRDLFQRIMLRCIVAHSFSVNAGFSIVNMPDPFVGDRTTVLLQGGNSIYVKL